MHFGVSWHLRIVARMVAIAMLVVYPYASADDLPSVASHTDASHTAASNTDANPSHEPVFDTDILPLLTKHGCNSGACHGAAVGRGNFALSLFGSDPDRDYRSIVHEYQGRRIVVADPESSLLLAKPTGGVAHGGNELFDTDSNSAQLLTRWIARGAPRGDAASLQSMTVQQDAFSHPASNTDPTANHSVRMAVTATFAAMLPSKHYSLWIHRAKSSGVQRMLWQH